MARKKTNSDDSGNADKQPKNSRKNPADHLKEHRFKKGISGNPNGRPQGSISLTTELKNRLSDGESGTQIVDALIARAIQCALDGDFKFWNMIMERIDGKVVDKVIHADVTPEFSDEDRKRIERLVKSADEWND
tara:strand:+ start:5853 stop:6254 length:402 start_codon:yes stop_codon:yes gene_type:complete